MGLRKHIQRWFYVYGWRFRYWYMDTQDGHRAQLALCSVAVLMVIIELIRMTVAALLPHPRQQPQQAIYWWVVQLIILIVSALISYATRPRPKEPAKAKADAPNTNDGQMVRHHFGDCWMDDSFILGWKVMGTIKIKSKGGKK